MTPALIESDVHARSLHDLQPGDHWCELYHDDREHLALLKVFFADGLAQNHKLLYIAEPDLMRRQFAELERAGLRVGDAVRRGQLVTRSPASVYLHDGRFDRARMFQQWEQHCAAALAEGYSALRAAGEPTWVLENVPGSEELALYEAQLNDFARTHPCVIFCQYDARRFPPKILLDVLSSHPVAVLDNAVLANPYFVPPGAPGDLPPDAARLTRCVEELRAQQQLEERRARDRAGPRTSQHHVRVMRALAVVSGWAAVVVALLVLLGYAFHSPRLATFGLGAVQARPLAAVALFLGAAALLLQLVARAFAWKQRLARLLAGAVTVIGALTIVEWVGGFSLPLDRLLFDAQLRAWQPLYPGRISLATAVAWLLLGGALLLLEWEPRPGLRVGQALALLSGVVTLIALQGYALGVPTISSFGLPIAMSLPIAIGATLLALGTLCARPDAGAMRVLSSAHPGGSILRWALPLTIGVIFLLGWFSGWGLERGFYPDGIEDLVFALPLTLLFGFAFFELARILNRASERQEEQHLQLENFNRELETRVRERTAELQRSEERYRSLVTATAQVVWMTDPQGWVDDIPMWRELTGQTREEVRGWGWLDAVHPEDRERVAALWRAALEQRSLYDVEYRIRAADGSWRQMSTHGVPVLERDGKVREWIGTCNDITAQKQAERVIRLQADRYANLIATTSDGYWCFDREGLLLEVNQNYCRMSGYSPQELLRMHVWELDPALTRERVLEHIALVRQSGFDRFETRHRRRDGSCFDAEVAASYFRAGDEFVLFVRDITARKQAQEALRLAERYARSLLEASLDPLVTISREGKITDVNAATEKVTGKTRSELVGTDFCEYFTNPEAARHGYQQAFAEGWVYDYPLAIRTDGTVTEVLYNATVFRNQAGEVEGVFAAARDVTARKRAESELRRLNRAYKALSRCSDAVTRAASEGTLLQEVCDLAVQVGGYRLVWVGYAQDDADRSVLPMAFAGQGADYVANARISWADTSERGRGPTGIAIRTGEPCLIADTVSDPAYAPWRESALRHGYHSVMTAPLKEGERTFGTLNIYAGEPGAFDAEERGLVVELAATLSHAILALRARAERDRAAAEVRALNETLERRVAERTAALSAANQELEAFTYSVAHDLRTPLRHIHGFVTLLAEDYAPQLDATAREYVQHVVRGSQQMGQLIDDLLNLSRVGRQQLVPQVVGLNRLVDDLRAELAPEAGERRVTWRVGDLPFLECDAALVRQVFHNLLANALKFTRPRAEAVIEVGRCERDGETVLFVRDNGVGFNMKYADKLFGVFQRLHRQEDFEGTGVGLVTVQRIVHKHGGRIWAEAELDRGATFYFTLGTPHDAPALVPALAGGDHDRTSG